MNKKQNCGLIYLGRDRTRSQVEGHRLIFKGLNTHAEDAHSNFSCVLRAGVLFISKLAGSTPHPDSQLLQVKVMHPSSTPNSWCLHSDLWSPLSLTLP